jgi:hypothetical protein
MPGTFLAAALLAIGTPADWKPLSFRNISPIRHEIADSDDTGSKFKITINAFEFTPH